MFEEKTELRKIARILGVELRTVQYHLEKKLKEYKELYNQFIKLLKERQFDIKIDITKKYLN